MVSRYIQADAALVYQTAVWVVTGQLAEDSVLSLLIAGLWGQLWRAVGCPLLYYHLLMHSSW